ncbi:MAG TPA: hypothetical protein VJX67_09940, partial [Blastocatellia bacterium]|nr:hypothetical protein [Blastocatellia bacterium]
MTADAVYDEPLMMDGYDVFRVPDQFLTLQAAVDATRRPTTIVVFPGIYEESVIVRDKQSLVIQS